MENSRLMDRYYDVVVVGAGAAGVGVGVALKHAGIENFLILDQHEVGASFEMWPEETRFITPSFPTNSIGMLDLNSIAIGVSPAYSIGVEHPTGKQFAKHLQGVAAFFDLPVQTGEKVTLLTKHEEYFFLHTEKQKLHAKHVIWATGEFQFPNTAAFPGAELCRHTSTISSYANLEGDDFLIIGGYESGVDAASHLADCEKKVRVIDQDDPWAEDSSDPSVALSTYSIERMQEEWFEEYVKLIPNLTVESVTQSGNTYKVLTSDGKVWKSKQPPLLANGFAGGVSKISDLFEPREEDGLPLLNASDESTLTEGLFLCGPSVRHDNHIFCFIYKFRQRFAVVAKEVATRLGLPAEDLEAYRLWGMYLDDLSCCGEECVC